MRTETIARNYAEALFDIAGRSAQPDRYADLIDAVAAAVETIPRVKAVLMSPRVPKAEKAKFLGAALKEAPRDFVLWLQALVKRGRQGILREVAAEYLALVDEKLNRVRASVTLARQPDDKLRQTIEESLARQLKKQVIAAYLVDPEILGGAVIRVGDRVLDGSVRRRMTKLRRQLLK
ncbi:MAG: ATP synthase F1 subunit delta [Gemmatimonadales bacterium]|nr:ATP synthase F1 subunit delta [Gemmatimonadales bacterium]MDQ3560225.1 ATP synthase F1 subunit delta [Pseudomonadota bacterium]